MQIKKVNIRFCSLQKQGICSKALMDRRWHRLLWILILKRLVFVLLVRFRSIYSTFKRAMKKV